MTPPPDDRWPDRRQDDAILRSLVDQTTRTGQELHGLAVQVATLAGSVGGLHTGVSDLKGEIRTLKDDFEDDLERMVEKVEFEPVKRIVFGMVGTMLLAILTALMAFVIQQRGN